MISNEAEAPEIEFNYEAEKGYLEHPNVSSMGHGWQQHLCIGNLIYDWHIWYSKAGKAYANNWIVTSTIQRSRVNKGKQKAVNTAYMRLLAKGILAEAVTDRYHKGDCVFVEAELCTRFSRTKKIMTPHWQVWLACKRIYAPYAMSPENLEVYTGFLKGAEQKK